MTTFNVIEATNAIAAIERTVTTPLPGIVNSFNYGADPVDFDFEDVPAIVHIERGPDSSALGKVGLTNLYMADFFIESRVLLIQDIVGQPPLEGKQLLADLYVPLFSLFSEQTARETILNASNAMDYEVIWEQPSFTRGDWPIFSNDYKRYWIIRYLHRLRMQN